MPRLYAAADAFVLPTRGEGFGMPIMEAMSMVPPPPASLAWMKRSAPNLTFPLFFLGSANNCYELVRPSGFYARTQRLSSPSRVYGQRGYACTVLTPQMLLLGSLHHTLPTDNSLSGRNKFAGQWAQPSVQHLQQLMRHVFVNREEAKRYYDSPMY
jgi:hypothetical protein